jgi:antitoxin VapB
MALSIKTEEADRLARVLSQLTGESLTRAVTIALRERLEREHARRAGEHNLASRLTELARRLRRSYDTHPVTREEWDIASGERQ